MTQRAAQAREAAARNNAASRNNGSNKPSASANRPNRSDVIPNVNGGRNTSGDRDVRSGGRSNVRDPDVIPNVNRPSLNKPTRDAIDRGNSDDKFPNVNQGGNGKKPDRDADNKSPNVHDLNNGKKPDRKNDVGDRTLGGAKPGEAIIKPVTGDPEVLQGFKPGRLNGKDDARNVRGGGGGGGGMGSVNRGAKDPETVAGLRNRDVRSGDANSRERVIKADSNLQSGEKFVKSSGSSCGHGVCGGHNNCVYAYDYCGPVSFCGSSNWCGNDGWGFSFSFGYVSSNWGFSVGYNNWYNDCSYYAPVYSCYRPVWPCYDYYTPYYYYRPYYCRPYYSLRYSYGGYLPRYGVFSSYNYAPYPRSSVYWWLYDNDDNYDSNYYGEGYNDGYSNGYNAGMENADDVGGYQPTWLGGGASTAGGATSEPYTPPAREIAPSNDGWDLLVAGDVREARRAFDRETLNAPGDGLPQIGYAATAGLMERYDEALAAMRKALRDDPDSFGETPRDAKIAEQMRTLLTHYRNVTREKPEDVDGLFMTAALRHLMGEDALAFFAVSKAIEAGDKDESAIILKTLIQRSLDAQPDVDEPAATTPASVPSVIEPATSPATGQPF